MEWEIVEVTKIPNIQNPKRQQEKPQNIGKKKNPLLNCFVLIFCVCLFTKNDIRPFLNAAHHTVDQSSFESTI